MGAAHTFTSVVMAIVWVVPLLLFATAAARAEILSAATSLPEEPTMTLFTGESWVLTQGTLLNVSLTTTPPDQLYYFTLMTTTMLGVGINTSFTAPGVYFQYPTVVRYQFQGTFEKNLVISSDDLYVFSLISLGGPNGSVDGTITYWSPQWGMLSYGDASVVPVCIFFTILYGVASIAWTWSTIKYKAKTGRLHHLLTVAVITNTISYVLRLGYYQLIANTGYEQPAILYISAVFSVVFNSAFVAFILLSALGYYIVRVQLYQRERQIFGAIYAIFFLFNCLNAFCVNSDLCPAFQLGFYVVEFLITFAIIVALNANMEWLRLAVASAHIVTAPVPNVKRAVGRIRTFRDARSVYFIYLVFPVFLLFVDFAVVEITASWLPPLVQGTVSMIMVFCTLYLYRPLGGQVHIPAPAEQTAAAPVAPAAAVPVAPAPAPVPTHDNPVPEAAAAN